MTTNSDASQAVELPPLLTPEQLNNIWREWTYKSPSSDWRALVRFTEGVVRAQFAAIAQDRAARAQAEPEGWREALQFYANKSHFALAEEDAWDTVSGEPANFWCDEAGTATVEDGTVAAMALTGTPLRDEDEDAARAVSADSPPTLIAANLLNAYAKLATDCDADDVNIPWIARIAAELRATPITPQAAEVPGSSVDAMVNRFLSWPLPKTFGPDCGISFDGRKDDQWNKNKTWPIGTNLFTSDEARALFTHALAAAATPTASAPKAEGCQHRIADARNPVVKDGYVCVDCGALFRAADHEPPSEADRTREGGDVVHGADDRDGIVKRMRRVASFVGVSTALPEDDATVYGALFTCLGFIACKLERDRAAMSQPKFYTGQQD